MTGDDRALTAGRFGRGLAMGFVAAAVGMLLGAHPDEPLAMIGVVLMAAIRLRPCSREC